MPTPRKPITKFTSTPSLSEGGVPKDNLMRLINIMQFRINLMKKKKSVIYPVTIKRWGFNYREIEELGIKI